MSLQSLHIKNFKSIVDFKIDNIPNFAVFAGTNGSGKSNIFEALEFIRDIIRNGAQDATKKHNGYENIHSHKLKGDNAKKFKALMEFKIGENTYTYDLEVRDWHKKPFLLEKVLKNDKEIAKRTLQNLFIFGDTQEIINYSSNETILKLVSKEAEDLLEFISSIERYQIDPNRAREADDYFANDTLDSYASNLTTVLSKIEKDQLIAEDITELMQMIVPGLEKISIEKERLNNKTVVTFKEEGTRKKFPAGLISDGTIYALAMLVIVYSNKNGIIMIEEPERGLNPKAISELVNTFREKSQTFNIFINTHSESIVRVTKPKELFIVDKHDGKTIVKNVKKAYPNYDYQKMDIDKMWMSNLFDGGLPW
jgi:predicted ATPase